MIDGGNVYRVFCAIVPLYVGIGSGFLSVRVFKILSTDQCAGINRYIAFIALPSLVFQTIAKTDMFKMNFLFLGADSTAKLFVLVVVVLFLLLRVAAKHLAVHRAFLWSASLFMLVSMPNTLIIGVPLLSAMYGEEAGDLMAQIVVLQSAIWMPLTIFLLSCQQATSLSTRRVHDASAPAHARSNSTDTAGTGSTDNQASSTANGPASSVDVSHAQAAASMSHGQVQQQQRRMTRLESMLLRSSSFNGSWFNSRGFNTVTLASSVSDSSGSGRSVSDSDRSVSDGFVSGRSTVVGFSATRCTYDVDGTRSEEPVETPTESGASSGATKLSSEGSVAEPNGEGQRSEGNEEGACVCIEVEESQPTGGAQSWDRGGDAEGSSSLRNGGGSYADTGSVVKEQQQRQKKKEEEEVQGQVPEMPSVGPESLPPSIPCAHCVSHSLPLSPVPTVCGFGHPETLRTSVKIIADTECVPLSLHPSPALNNPSGPSPSPPHVPPPRPLPSCGFGYPEMLRTSVKIIADTGLGMSMFSLASVSATVASHAQPRLGECQLSLGLFMASQKSLLTCGVWHTVWSLALRFALTPLTTALFAFLFGIRGKLFRIIAMQPTSPLTYDPRVSPLSPPFLPVSRPCLHRFFPVVSPLPQSALPPGVVTFALANEYKSHTAIHCPSLPLSPPCLSRVFPLSPPFYYPLAPPSLLQSALPPGVVTFVLANEYKSHTAIHSTGAHDICCMHPFLPLNI
ncbi:unnamed protein product [Closterium sp. NIES-65]|nr:unnamed protein product [Closterium sp. NIES-65]